MPFVQPGGTVLVTGASGYIGGITVQKFLDAGYRVRGTVRDVNKYEWMLDHYGSNFELVEIPDMALDGAFDSAVKDVNGIAHVASPTGESYQPDPQVVIPRGIRYAVGLLESAAKSFSVKSVVYTSSQAAAVMMEPNKPYHINPTSWNEESKKAWTMPVTQDFRRSLYNYMCAKTEAEQQSIKWVKDNEPAFSFNTVVPNLNFGVVARPDKTGFLSSSGLLKLLWQGNDMPVNLFPPQYFIDVEDTALLHVAVLTQPDVQNEHIFAMAKQFNYTEVWELFKRIAPDHTFLEKVGEILDHGTVENERSEELLKRAKQGKGWSTLGETIEKWATQMTQWEKEGQDWPVTVVEQMIQVFEGLPLEQRSLYG